MHPALRIARLGTEPAFAVSGMARALAERGHRIYPFHIGDLNIATPANIIAAQQRALAEGKTGYVSPAGIAPLREALADDTSARRGVRYSAENVAVQPGGKPVITKFVQALMNPGDEVLYPSPGFPIYESQVEYFGGAARAYRYVATGDGFGIDLDHLESLITPRTRLLIFNDNHNPLAAQATRGEIERLADIALRHDLWVLSDDAYYEVCYAGQPEHVLSVPGMEQRTVLLYTFSKKYAMTGWRLGAAIGPREIIDVIARLNVNDESCTAAFVQWAGVEALRGDPAGPRAILDELRQRRDLALSLLRDIEGVTAHPPRSTFYLFPNVTGAMARKGFDDVNAFAEASMRECGVSFCTRDHFGRRHPGETEHYIRLAYSGISQADIREGLAAFKRWLAS